MRADRRYRVRGVFGLVTLRCCGRNQLKQQRSIDRTVKSYTEPRCETQPRPERVQIKPRADCAAAARNPSDRYRKDHAWPINTVVRENTLFPCAGEYECPRPRRQSNFSLSFHNGARVVFCFLAENAFYFLAAMAPAPKCVSRVVSRTYNNNTYVRINRKTKRLINTSCKTAFCPRRIFVYEK